MYIIRYFLLHNHNHNLQVAAVLNHQTIFPGQSTDGSRPSGLKFTFFVRLEYTLHMYMQGVGASFDSSTNWGLETTDWVFSCPDQVYTGRSINYLRLDPRARQSGQRIHTVESLIGPATMRVGDKWNMMSPRLVYYLLRLYIQYVLLYPVQVSQLLWGSVGRHLSHTCKIINHIAIIYT